MRALLITINYPPEIGGAPHLIHELAIGLKEQGHQVTVLTGYPQYNMREIPRQYRRGLTMKDTLDGVAVRRIRIPHLPRASKIARGVEHIVFGLWLGALFALSARGDVALVFSPPLPLPWLVSMIGRLRRIPVVVNIQDLFPREAIELGMLANPMLIHLFEAMERQVHRLATAITVHSPGNRKHVIDRAGNPKRVYVVYNWVNTDQVHPGPQDNEWARSQGLPGHFVVSYAGTMGWAQDMATIIAAAAKLKDRPDILFLLVGDGVQKAEAMARCAELGLGNVQWLPMQPLSVYQEILASSHVCLINLHPDLRTPVVPSKLLSIMAAARPVVASLPAESDARDIVAQAGCGICVAAGDGQALAQAILQLEADRALADQMGRRGRAYVETHFSRQVCARQVEAILRGVIQEAA